MRTLRLLGVLVLSLVGMAARAQVTVSPFFFTADTPITITFDAKQGNAGLAGYTDPVYIWTGAITDKSSSDSDWKGGPRVDFSKPDPAGLMTSLGNDKYSISFTPRTFYGLAATDQLLKLGMLFRSGDGSKSGRTSTGGDIYVNAQTSALQVALTSPATTGGNPAVVAAGTALAVTGLASASATLTLTLNGTQVAQQTGTALNTTVTITQPGVNTLVFSAASGTTTATTTATVLVPPTVPVAALPAGANADGVTYLNNGTSAILTLTAPNKSNVYVLGDFNNWQLTNAGLLSQTATVNSDPATGRWWIQLNGLTPGTEYAYQFLVDGQLRVADPYCEKILDQDNDKGIPAVTYPNLKAYPAGSTTGIVSVLSPGAPAYTWTTTNFQRPARTNMVVYELLVRDFVARHDYQTLRDTLGYIQRLGANTIELMPINEFDGNENWGYSPSFYFAPDKYYGTKNNLKALIDECHRRGMAVVLDVVLNHSTGNSPMVQLYGSSSTGPTADSPWFNVTAPHPYSVYFDLNHASAYTKYFTKNVIKFWLQEYHIDGYRYDLAGGFTQKQTTTATFENYDQTRIDIWKDYYNYQVGIDATSYPILEHFPDNDEGKVLADYGLMLWGNLAYSYQQAEMGYSDGWDMSSGYYGARNWAQPNLVSYMESHDEERTVFKNKAYGNSSGTYSVKDQATALQRDEMAAALFFTQPGPRMVWQFGEVGYDYSINACSDGTIISNDCRTADKPIRWDYYQDANRRHLYDTYRSLIALKKQPVFAAPTSYAQSLGGAVKTTTVAGPDLSVVTMGNFDVVAKTATITFPQTGTWYNYLTGTSRAITAVSTAITLQPGEYAVYTSKRLSATTGTVLATRPQTTATFQLTVSPSPTATTDATLHYELPAAAAVSVTVVNMLGATVRTVPLATSRQAAGAHELALPVASLANGVYLVRLQADGLQQVARLLVQH